MLLTRRRVLCALGIHSFIDSGATYRAQYSRRYFTAHGIDSESICLETGACRFCSAKMNRKLRHDFALAYRASECCDQQMTCKRCGCVSGYIQVIHTWSAWSDIVNCVARRRRCERCGCEEQEGHRFVSEGAAGHRCSICGLGEGHRFDRGESFEYEAWNSDFASFTTTGTDWYCSGCGEEGGRSG